MAVYRRHQTECHCPRHRPGAGILRRGHPQRLDLRTGLLRNGRQRHVFHARRGGESGTHGLPARHRQQVVPPVPRAGTHLCPPLRRGAGRLPPPAQRRAAEPRQLPDSGRPLRAGAAALLGHRHARLGRSALRPHPGAEHHETAAAGRYAPDGQGRRRGRGHGRSGALRGRTPRRAGRPLRHSGQGFAGQGRIRPGIADRLDRRGNAHVAGRFLQRPPRLPGGAGRYAAAFRVGQDAARHEDQTFRDLHLRHAFPTANITPSSIRWPRRLPSATRRTGASWNFMPNT